MIVTTRPATSEDAPAMVALLNDIIAAGGTTAYEEPFDVSRMQSHYIAHPKCISCTVAERDGDIVGFQGLFWPYDPADPFPEGWAFIATFVQRGLTGRGIGGRLFEATRSTAEAAEVRVIDATIRADNAGGLTYYGRMGFVDYDRLVGFPLKDGTPMDRVRKRFDL